ncbi:MAG TPA: ATP-binding protein [Longimicrobiales bacterium]
MSDPARILIVEDEPDVAGLVAYSPASAGHRVETAGDGIVAARAISRERPDGGARLGLSIVKHLVARMGGEVAAESRPGKGTTIRLRLPTASEAGAGGRPHLTLGPADVPT